jgi:hypothetical protein
MHHAGCVDVRIGQTPRTLRADQKELMMRKPGLAMMIVLFAASTGLAFATSNAGEGNAAVKQAPAHPPKKNATVEYQRAQKRIKADYQADQSVCHSKKGDAETQCLKQAKARKKQAMADAGKSNKQAQAAGQH